MWLRIRFEVGRMFLILGKFISPDIYKHDIDHDKLIEALSKVEIKIDGRAIGRLSRKL